MNTYDVKWKENICIKPNFTTQNENNLKMKNFTCNNNTQIYHNCS